MNRIRWHMQLKQQKIYFMVWTLEISNEDENWSIIKLYMEGNKCGNVLWYSYWRTHPHTNPHIEKKHIDNNRNSNCGNDN